MGTKNDFMYTDEAEALKYAKQWSKDVASTVTVIHGPSESAGLVYYVEIGDGGIVRNTERIVAQFDRGHKIED